MNMKKILVSAIIVVMFGTGLTATFSKVNAKSETSMYLGLSPFMTQNPKFGYSINGYFGYNQDGDFANRSAAKIWNILKYKSTDPNGGYDENEDIFCLREGEGFLNNSGESDSGVIKEYNESFNMKTDKTDVKTKIHDWSKTIDGVNQYDAILAVLDLFYTQGNSDEYRQSLLENAIGKEKYNEYSDAQKITDYDIKAVEQVALWYFTNYDENNNGLYDQTNNPNWLRYTTNGEDYTQPLSQYKKWEGGIGPSRDEQASLLYNYLIETAKENAKNYSNTTDNLENPIKVTTTKLEHKESGDNYILGPINISKQESASALDNIDIEVKNGDSSINNFVFLDEDNKVVNKNVKDLLGKDFYISVPKSGISISKVKVNLNIKYSTTNLKLWTHSTNKDGTQPVVIPKRSSDSTKVTLSTEGVFDLALRKYITKVNGKELTGTNSRVPNIDESTLKTGTTATYKHRKDPVIVKKGDIITYKMTIYNEGEKEGRATKVIDQLPTGLKFKNVISGNFDKNSYDESTNMLTLQRKTSNTDDLKAYTSGNLDSETIEIECEVVDEPDTENAKILTNVAWISEEYDSESNITIISQQDADRDSVPSNAPNVNKDNMSDYKGNNTKDDLANSNYYYKGQEDDDDFEKVVIMPESFDLKLIKRITAVNNKSVTERIKSVDVSKLNTIGEDGNLITTGDYKLDKNPVVVKTGDIVTYTFRVYNEGTVDGYASEITENIPEGLEFIWSDKTGDELKSDTTLTDEEKEAIEFNQDRLWLAVYDDKGENIVKITTDYLSQETNSENLIKAFGENEDGTKTENDISYKEVAVKLKVVAENNNEDIVRNEACISKDTDKDGNEVTDRDSVPEEWKKENSGKYYDDNKKWPIYNEDDEDYDNITLQFFDLSLRKYITSVNGVGVAISREPVVDVTPLKEGTSTSAIYKHKKDPVEVKIGDVVTYNIRVYNEGGMDGYAAELTEYFPTYLAFDEKDELNQKYGWKLNNDSGSNGIGMLKTTYLNNKLLKAYDGEDKLDYADMQVNFIVKSDVGLDTVMTNTTEISVYEDAAHRSVKDRDSGEQWNIGILEYGIPLLKQVLTDEYVSQGKMTEEAVDYTCEYVTIVFKDYIPNYNLRDYGLSAYLQTKNMTSQQFVAGAKQYVESKGETIPDEALQLAYKTIGDDSNEELLEKYKEYIDQFFQSYKGVNENKAELSDSGYYYSGQEDDDDFEKIIILKTFDLALRKWVTQAIVIENGQQSITNTGHDAWDDPEEIVKVDLHRKKLDQVTVKFKYSIRVYNQGNVEGYVKEITDYIPEGLKFVAEDNPGWTDEGNNVISTTLLENTLLKPEEYADVEVLLTWINDENNMGLKVNTAEISKDYNEYHLPDIDSTPDNKKQGEDDIDDAPVMLSVSTGQIRIYFTVGIIILVTMAGGTILIKKYVL